MLPMKGAEMTTQITLDSDSVPSRIANVLPQPLIEEFWREAKHIKSAETQLQMRRIVLVTKLREKGMSWDSCGWFFGATGEAVRKVYGTLLGEQEDAPDMNDRGKGKPGTN